MRVSCACGVEYQSKPAPCPDNQKGCCVAHYNTDSFICPACQADNHPRWDTSFQVEMGLGVGNVEGVSKLKLGE